MELHYFDEEYEQVLEDAYRNGLTLSQLIHKYGENLLQETYIYLQHKFEKLHGKGN